MEEGNQTKFKKSRDLSMVLAMAAAFGGVDALSSLEPRRRSYPTYRGPGTSKRRCNKCYRKLGVGGHSEQQCE